MKIGKKKDILVFLPIIGRIIILLHAASKRERPLKVEVKIFLENTLLYTILGMVGGYVTSYFNIVPSTFISFFLVVFLIVGFYEYRLMKKNPAKFLGNESDVNPVNVSLVFYHQYWFLLLGYFLIYFF